MSPTLKHAALAGIFILFLSAGYGYMYHLLLKAAEDADRLATEVATEVQRGEELRVMQASLDEVEEERKELDSYFLAQDGLIDLLGTFEDLGNSHGAELEVASVNEVAVSLPKSVSQAATQTHPALKLSITIAGSWAAVFHTTALLESFPLPITVEDMTFEKTRGSDEVTPQWQATMQLIIARDT